MEKSYCCFLWLIQKKNNYLEAKSAFGVFEISTGRGGTIESLVVDKDGLIHIGTIAANGEDGTTATFHNLNESLEIN